MSGSIFGDVLTALVFVALVTTLVAHKGTAGDITAAGNAFSGSIRAATANGGDLGNLPDLPSRS
jgi:hypothetical protein